MENKDYDDDDDTYSVQTKLLLSPLPYNLFNMNLVQIFFIQHIYIRWTNELLHENK